eukprot:TRINITY_DN5666_c0_g1_i4.p1 TRINITY_DN5666_c0_g1~~TRINITY_DN5666_c0_g1_i4.p1  ORF type:complete len:440 (-),score=59.52 TRINITY_DN5666_c0_g1_i4:800-2119(-)
MSLWERNFVGGMWMILLVAGADGRALFQQESSDTQSQEQSIRTIDLNDLDLDVVNNQKPSQAQQQQVDDPSPASIVELLQQYSAENDYYQGGTKKQEAYQANNYDGYVTQKSAIEIVFLSKLSNIEVYPTKILDFATLQHDGQSSCSIKDEILKYNKNCGNNNKPCLFQFEKYMEKIMASLNNNQYLSGTFFVPQDSAFEKLLSDDQQTLEILLYHLIPKQVVLPKEEKKNKKGSNNNNVNSNGGSGDYLLDSLVADKIIIPMGPMLNSSLGNLGDLIINSKGGIELWGNPAEVLKPNIQMCSLTIHIVDHFLLPQQIRKSLQGIFVQDVMQEYDQPYMQAARVASGGSQIPQEQQQNQQYTPPQNSYSNGVHTSDYSYNQSQGIHIDTAVVVEMFNTLSNIENNAYQQYSYVQTISASDIGLTLPPSNEQSYNKNNNN